MSRAKQIIESHSEKLSESKEDDVIKELIDTGWAGSNAEQMKAVQLLKGLATSDAPEANAFMKKLDTFTSGMKANANEADDEDDDDMDDKDDDVKEKKKGKKVSESVKDGAKALTKAFVIWKKDAPANLDHITKKLEPLIGPNGAVKSIK